MVFFIRFIVLTGLLFLIDIIPWTKQHIVDVWTTILAYISAYIMQLFDADVISQGIDIIHKASGKGVRIEAGCNGIEATIILLAAIFALEIKSPPASDKKRLSDFFAKLVIAIMIFFTINTMANILKVHIPYLSNFILNITFIVLCITALTILWLSPVILEPVASRQSRIQLLIFKVVSSILAFMAIQSLNTLRIICLYYLYLWNEAWFEFAHLYLWPALLIIDAIIVFLYWLYRVQLKYPFEIAEDSQNADTLAIKER